MAVFVSDPYCITPVRSSCDRSCFYIVMNPASWGVAYNHCKRNGDHLANIETPARNRLISSILQTHTGMT